MAFYLDAGPCGYNANFFLSFFLSFFVRKIGPELTSANPPLFAEEDWPWANIHAHLPLLYMGHRHSMAQQAVQRCTPGIRTGEPRAAAAERVHLTACATRLAPTNYNYFLLRFLLEVGEDFTKWDSRVVFKF